MSPAVPASLDTAALARRLAQFTGDERAIQVEFLLHLDVFDRRRAWLEAGHPSLWDYCLRVLHLREGAAARRLRAMRMLRRRPELAAPLRDGRICLTTLGLLEPVLTAENAGELIARAAYRSKAEAMGAPGAEPAMPTGTSTAAASPSPTATATRSKSPTPTGNSILTASPIPIATEASDPTATSAPTPTQAPAPCPTAELDAAAPPLPRQAQASRPILRPVAADTWSLRVTLDAALKQEFDQLAALLSHKFPSGDLSAVLREAVHCALEKHGKRKGAFRPARTRQRRAPVAPQAPAPSASPSAAPASRSAPRREAISAEVRRQVWLRDEGRCAWTSPDGHRCGSRWKVEVDHLEPAALGGPSTLDNLRLTCAAHNRLHAERTFGRSFMDRFRRGTPRMSESTVASGSASGACAPG